MRDGRREPDDCRGAWTTGGRTSVAANGGRTPRARVNRDPPPPAGTDVKKTGRASLFNCIRCTYGRFRGHVRARRNDGTGPSSVRVSYVSMFARMRVVSLARACLRSFSCAPPVCAAFETCLRKRPSSLSRYNNSAYVPHRGRALSCGRPDKTSTRVRGSVRGSAGHAVHATRRFLSSARYSIRCNEQHAVSGAPRRVSPSRAAVSAAIIVAPPAAVVQNDYR